MDLAGFGVDSLLSRVLWGTTCLLAWTRHHWGIENGLHYRRDITLKEDANRMSGTAQASVVATINNFIVGLAGQLGFTNLPTMLRMADAKINLALYNYL